MTKTIIKQSIRLAPTRAPIPRRLLGAIALGAFGLPALQAQDESLADLRAQLAALEAKVAALESARLHHPPRKSS